ncbi:hypothetical protein Taro_043894, partial [Colocasia esculenta]|nr:hypothetical protein [Colocasia esculenta]
MVFAFFRKGGLHGRSGEGFRIRVVACEVGCPKFCVSQARVFVVLGVYLGTCVVPPRSMSSVLDTLTPVFELYVRLRERRQWDNDLELRPESLKVPGMGLQVVGPFVRDCETESGLLVVVLPAEVCPGVGTVVVVVGERRLTGCGLTHVVCPVVGTVVSGFCPWWRALWWHWFGCGFRGGVEVEVLWCELSLLVFYPSS